MTTEYATTQELNEFIGMYEEVPSPLVVGDTRVMETVGVGDGSSTRFFLDNAYVIASSYSLYYGATEEASLSQPLTETTHYTIDKDLGKITLTSAGVTLIGTDNIYAAYSYNQLNFKDSELQDVLDRAGSYVDKETHNHWTDGTATTPDYNQILNEKHDGRGTYKRSYYTDNRPLPELSTVLSSDAAIGATTLTVSTTNGFLSSGSLLIGGEKISYSSKASTTTFTVTATTISHSSGDKVLPFVFEASSSVDGTSPTWTVLEEDSDFDIDYTTGRIHFSAQEMNITDAQAYSVNPQHRTPNRFRMSYLWGNDSIPDTVKQLTLMVSAKEILHKVVRKAHATGLNDFNPALINVDDATIKKLIIKHKNANIGATP